MKKDISAMQRIVNVCEDSPVDVRRRLHQIELIARSALAAEKLKTDKETTEPMEDEAPSAVWK